LAKNLGARANYWFSSRAESCFPAISGLKRVGHLCAVLTAHFFSLLAMKNFRLLPACFGLPPPGWLAAGLAARGCCH
jgi:hypothetical protein